MRHLNAKYMKSIVAKTLTPKLGAALVLSALVCLAGLQATEAGVNVWTSIGPYGETISTLAIDPQNPATLYAAGRGDPGSVLTGVLKSTDGSGTWSAVNSGLTDLRIYTPAIDPATPTTLYAGTGGAGLFRVPTEATPGTRSTPASPALPSVPWLTRYLPSHGPPHSDDHLRGNHRMDPAHGHGDGELHRRMGSRGGRHHAQHGAVELSATLCIHSWRHQ